MSKQSESGSQSICVVGLLGVVFVTLKLLGVINWSWWWVTAPFWGGLVLVLIILFIFFLVSLIAMIIKRKQLRRMD